MEKIVPISEIIRKRQRTILGHVMRADASDPMFQVSFNGDFEIVVADGRRSGRPRQHFLETNMEDVYWDLYEDIYDETDLVHRTNLIQRATDRDF